MRKIRIATAAGYSLIEMALVLTIVGIVTTLGVAQMGPALEHERVRSAANVVSGDLQYAQMLAVRERRPIAVIVSRSTRQYLIRDRDSASVVYRTRLLGDDTEYALDQVIGSRSTVELYPNGMTRRTVTITLGLRGFQRRVRITKAGQIRVLP